jgi:hypothetical protein
MKVELLVVPDCPHAADTETLLATALRDVGLSDVAIATVSLRPRSSPDNSDSSARRPC